MASSIVQQQETELVPSLDQASLLKAIMELDLEVDKLPELRSKAEKIEIKTPDDFAKAGVLLGEVRAVRDSGNLKIGPFDAIVKRVQFFLKTKRNEVEAEGDAIDAILVRKLKDFAAIEKEATAEEQEDVNKDRKKAGLAPISVKPSIPTIPGFKLKTNWKWNPVDISKAKREYLTWDMLKINKEVRDMHENAEKKIGKGSIQIYKD